MHLKSKKKLSLAFLRLMHKEQELNTLEWDWDIHNPDRLINLEINNKSLRKALIPKSPIRKLPAKFG